MNRPWIKSILCGDSKDIIKRIPDNSIDFILTVPPYNIGKYSTGNIPLPGRTPINNDLAEWDLIDFNPADWVDEFIRILKPNGNLFIFTSYNQIGKWYEALDHKFDTTNFMVWHKTNPAPKIFKAGFLNSCELIFTCWNKGHTWNFISQAEMHNFYESAICMRPERLSDPKHPAQKPVSLLKKLITIASNENDIVFDPFMGVGSTGVAALQLNRKFIGVEIDQRYFNAAKRRIDELIVENMPSMFVEEEKGEYVSKDSKSKSDLSEIECFIQYLNENNTTFVPQQKYILFDDEEPTVSRATGLKPLLKWAGGKEKELKFILPNLPEQFDRYIEPFVGGGSVFMGINAKQYHINDLSTELMALYVNISEQNEKFFTYVNDINSSWQMLGDFAQNCNDLIDIYKKFSQNLLTANQLKISVKDFCDEHKEFFLDIISWVGDVPKIAPQHAFVFLSELNKNLFRKMNRMKTLEAERHALPLADLQSNIETALKSGLYMYYRHLYNDQIIKDVHPIMHCALFLFIRCFAYSGMFRFNDRGEFNVPYGGIAYNNNDLTKKLNYYQSLDIKNKFNKTTIYNLDFEIFLKNLRLTEQDFIFLDPPYDSEFSTYDKNEFSRDDHRRLADFLTNNCPAKWLLIIKNTDFIFDLYNKPSVNITSFDKQYAVSFMNRNNKKVTHLIIKNY